MLKLYPPLPASPAGIFLVRVLVGYLIMRHSHEMFNPDQLRDLLNFLNDVKFPLPAFSGYAAKWIELAGGLLLAVGLFTRIATLLLLVVMAGVIYTMNGGNPFNGELAFLFGLFFILFFIIGPGRWSLDYLLFGRAKIARKALK